MGGYCWDTCSAIVFQEVSSVNQGSEGFFLCTCGSCPMRVVGDYNLANGRSVFDIMEWGAFVGVELLKGIQKVMKLYKYHTSLKQCHFVL